jgi:hypothetical protein
MQTIREVCMFDGQFAFRNPCGDVASCMKQLVQLW